MQGLTNPEIMWEGKAHCSYCARAEAIASKVTQVLETRLRIRGSRT